MKKLLGASALALVFMAASAKAETINILVEGGGEMLQKAVAEKFSAETGIKVNFTVVPYRVSLTSSQPRSLPVHQPSTW